jgi:DNA-directed RNA polymerase specialized sigma24 family protein
MTEIDAKIKALYLEGLSKNKISKELGLSLPRVNYVLYIKLRMQDSYRRKHITPSMVEKLPKPIVDRIIVLTNFGYSAKEIAEDQRIPTGKVHQVVEFAKARNQIQKKI